MSDKPSAIQLVKLLLLSIYRVVAIIVKNNWEPFYTTIVKMSIVALILWGIASVVPHGIIFISDISFLGWLSLITIYRLVTIKYDDFEEPELAEVPSDEVEDEEEVIEEEINTQREPLRNVIDKKEVSQDDNTSTRE
jgi:hypothetical protein